MQLGTQLIPLVHATAHSQINWVRLHTISDKSTKLQKKIAQAHTIVCSSTWSQIGARYTLNSFRKLHNQRLFKHLKTYLLGILWVTSFLTHVVLHSYTKWHKIRNEIT